jgi:hypothetical protein
LCPWYYSLTSFECIFLEFTFDIVGSPAVGETGCLWDAAAATGTENKDMDLGDALLKIEANTLAACAGLACKIWLRACGSGARRWDGSRCLIEKGPSVARGIEKR